MNTLPGSDNLSLIIGSGSYTLQLGNTVTSELTCAVGSRILLALASMSKTDPDWEHFRKKSNCHGTMQQIVFGETELQNDTPPQPWLLGSGDVRRMQKDYPDDGSEALYSPIVVAGSPVKGSLKTAKFPFGLMRGSGHSITVLGKTGDHFIIFEKVGCGLDTPFLLRLENNLSNFNVIVQSKIF